RAVVRLFVRQEAGVAASHAARHDRHFVGTVVVGHEVTDDGVSALVIGGHTLFVWAHHTALAFGASDHAVDCLLEFAHGDDLLVAPCGEDGGLVHEVREIGAAEAGRCLGEDAEHDVVGDGLALGVDVEDRLAALDVGRVEDDFAVETARPQECGVEDVGPVRGGDDDYVRARIEAVHFDEDLVQGLLAFVVASAEPGAALAANGVDFVDEDDAWRVFLGLVQAVADAAGADANEHFDELRAGNAEERHTRFASDRSGQQRLAGPWRANEEYTLGDARAEGGELLRVFEEFDDFGELFFCFIDTRDIAEGDGDFAAGEEARTALPEAHCLGVRTLRLPHDQQQEQAEEQEREDVEQEPKPWPKATTGLVFEVDGRLIRACRGVAKCDVLVGEQLLKVGVRANLGGLYDSLVIDLLVVGDGEVTALDIDLLDLVGFDVGDDLAD